MMSPRNDVGGAPPHSLPHTAGGMHGLVPCECRSRLYPRWHRGELTWQEVRAGMAQCAPCRGTGYRSA